VSGAVRTSTFVKVLVVLLAVIAGLGLLIHTLNGAHHRPEGIAEHWLSAIGDTGRRGVSADARRRAEKIGPISVATPLLPAGPHDHRLSYFSGLEVGKARIAGVARVPFRLHQQLDSGSSPARKGILVLNKSGHSWKVASLDGRHAGELVASEGGPPAQPGSHLGLDRRAGSRPGPRRPEQLHHPVGRTLGPAGTVEALAGAGAGLTVFRGPVPARG
jgi:hypothetical protein